MIFTDSKKEIAVTSRGSVTDEVGGLRFERKSLEGEQLNVSSYDSGPLLSAVRIKVLPPEIYNVRVREFYKLRFRLEWKR